jgi:uncharacterized protein
MTNEERDMISQFIARVGGAPAGAPSNQWGGSVPATTQPALPPVDPEANALINQSFQRSPDTAYRMTQLAFVQEHALAEAQSRIKRMEWELQQAQQQAQAAQQAAQQAPQPSGGSSGGFFGGLFGGRSQAPPQPQPGPSPVWNQGGPAPAYQPQYQQAAPPPPQYAPNYQPGMFQRSGSGFLGSALTTAAGVGGGILAANALMGLFDHHGETGGGAFGGGSTGGGFPGGAPSGESPWGGAAPAGTPGQDYVDQGTWDNAGGAAPSNQDYVDNGTWDQPQPTDAPDDNSGGGDAGWDSGDAGGGGGGSDSLC